MCAQKLKKKTYQTVDEVIARLQELKQERGNIPVRLYLAGINNRAPISGIRYDNSHADTGEMVDGAISIVAKYDVWGIINELAACNSIVRQFADLKLLFVNYATVMMNCKALLEAMQKQKTKGTYNGNAVEIVPTVKKEFSRLFDVAKQIRDIFTSLKDFDKRLTAVVKEPIRDADYTVAFQHHIDENMSDAEFANLITDGAGGKTSIHRMAAFLGAIDKINQEIENRSRRLAALDKRIASEKNSNEGLVAKKLKCKTQSIIDTLIKRREYVADRYSALKDSVVEDIKKMNKELSEYLLQFSNFEPLKNPRRKKRA